MFLQVLMLATIIFGGSKFSCLVRPQTNVRVCAVFCISNSQQILTHWVRGGRLSYLYFIYLPILSKYIYTLYKYTYINIGLMYSNQITSQENIHVLRQGCCSLAYPRGQRSEVTGSGRSPRCDLVLE